MRWRLPVLGLTFSLLGGCASEPTLSTLIEQRQVVEQRALGRFESGDLVNAAQNYRQAAQLAELADNRVALVTNLVNLGAVEHQLGNYDAGLLAYERALRLAAMERRADMELRAIAGLAEINYRQGNRDVAKELYQQLIDHPAARGDSELQIMALNGLALCLLDGNDTDAATRYLARAEALGETPATLLNRATLELRRGELAGAEKAARRALELDRASGYVPGIASDLEVLGELSRLSGEEEEAHLYFTQSLSLYEQLRSPSAILRLRQRRDALSR